MKYMKKISALTLAATTLCFTCLPIYAEDESTTKEESVYAVLNSDGSIKEVTVSDNLHSDTGFDHYSDTSVLKDVQNLKSSDPIKTTNDGYEWTTDAKDIYYQGTSTKALPLNVSIHYTLDGKDYKEDELLGKSGHLKITMHITNTSTRSYEVNGKTYDLVTPFVTVAGSMMDMDTFQNVKVNHGTVQSDSSHYIVASAMIPSLREGLSQVMSADMLDKLDNYLYEDIEVEADVTNFVSPSIMLAASTDTKALEDDLADTDFDNVFDQLDELKDATDQLVTGTKDIYDGAVKLNDGVGSAQDGVQKLLNGATDLQNGTSQVSEGAQKLSGGASQLSAGLTELNSHNGELQAGSAQLTDGVFQLVNTVLQSQGFNAALTPSDYANFFAGQFEITPALLQQAKQTIADQTQLPIDSHELNSLLFYAAKMGEFDADTLTKAGAVLQTAQVEGENVAKATAAAGDTFNDPDVQAMLAEIKQNIAQDPTQSYQMIYPSIHQQVAQAVSQYTQDPDVVDQIIAYALENYQQLDQEHIGAAVQAILTGQTATAIKDENPVVLAVCQAKVSDIPDATIYQTLVNQVNPDDPQTAAVVIAYSAKYGDANLPVTQRISACGQKLIQLNQTKVLIESGFNADGSLTAEADNLINSKLQNAFIASFQGNDSLKQLKQLLDGVLTLKAGINDYTAGVSSALAGSKELADGASQLRDGAKKVNDGAGTLKQGIGSLSTGMKALKDGSDALASGAKKLMDGMAKYKDEAISKLTENDKIADLQNATDLFHAVKEEGDHYNNYSGISEGTDGSVKFIFKVNGAKQNKNAKADSTEAGSKEEKESFWTRIVNLFKF